MHQDPKVQMVEVSQSTCIKQSNRGKKVENAVALKALYLLISLPL